MSKKEIQYLLNRYLSRNISEEELTLLFQELEKDSSLWKEAFTEMIQNYPEDKDYKPQDWERMIQAILEEGKKNEKVERKWLKKKIWIQVAASLLLVIGLGIWFYDKDQNTAQDDEIVTNHPEENQIHPGGNKAVLRLANGQNIVLDSLPNGQVAVGGIAKITKIDGGKIAYQQSDASTKEMQYNTLITPRGGQYQLVLPDGSRVWLNAESSIRYPTHFTETERKVKVSGETYFEVKKDAKRPFIVQVEHMKVKVLGTQFNIRSYKNDASVNTTLVDGAVEVSNSGQKVQLEPGQQARLSEVGELHVVQVPNLEKIVAWKNGLFYFEQDNLDEAMKKIARWYNIKVNYKGAIPKGHITGKIPRKSEINDVLEIMKLSGVQFNVGKASINVRAKK